MLFAFYCILTVLALDQGDSPMTSSAAVTILVLDVNDNSPRFTNPSYHGNIDENSGPGTLVNMVSYQVIQSQSINQSINLSINQSIRNEMLQAYYSECSTIRI